MKLLVLAVFAICVLHQVRTDGILGSITNAAKSIVGKVLDKSTTNVCEKDVHNDFYDAAFDFAVRLYKRVGVHNEDHFVISQISMWLSLAAIAEGTEGEVQKQLFTALNLPKEKCLREKYYQIALSREPGGDDVTLSRKRILLVDQSVKLNSTWLNYVKSVGLMEVSTAPLKSEPASLTEQLKNFIPSDAIPKELGNSIILDSLDYEALWATAFPEASIVKEPFYDDEGKQIGMVDYMKIKKKVKLAHIPLINAKVLDMPIGTGRYHMLMVLGISKNPIRSSIDNLLNRMLREVLNGRQESLIPLDVAIPRFKLDFYIDASQCLDEIGVGSIWKNPEATSLISDPPLNPKGLYQRVSAKIEPRGLEVLSEANNSTGIMSSIANSLKNAFSNLGLAAVLGRDFIANRPFMFGFLDTETETVLMGGAFSKPYYKN